MAGTVQTAEGENLVDMNCVPLIDVMLVLLILFIVTIPIQTHAVKLDMPRPKENPEQVEPPEVVDLLIDFDGTVEWNGTRVADEGQLTDYFRSVVRKDVQDEIHVRPNRLVKYNYVARVLGIAQRMGIKKLGFVGNDQFL